MRQMSEQARGEERLMNIGSTVGPNPDFRFACSHDNVRSTTQR